MDQWLKCNVLWVFRRKLKILYILLVHIYNKKKCKKTEIIKILNGESSDKFYKNLKEAINYRENLLQIITG